MNPQDAAREKENAMERLREIVGQAIGEASMCWVPAPSHEVFDSTRASAIVDNVMESFVQYLQESHARGRDEERSRCAEIIETDASISAWLRRSLAAAIREGVKE